MLLRSQGRAAWRRFNEALAEGRIPHREVIDGVLVIFGGVLLLTPGFITDIFGAAVPVPAHARAAARLLVRRGALRVVGAMPGHAEPAVTQRPPARHRGHRRGHRLRLAGPTAVSAAELEAPRPFRKPGDTDAVTYSWADPEAGLYGLARVAAGVDRGRRRARRARWPSRSRAASRWARSPRPARRRRAELVAETEAPLERWTLRAEGELRFELTFEALTPPAEYGGRQAVVKAGGMEGYEQLCRVRGTMQAGGRERPCAASASAGTRGATRTGTRSRSRARVGAWFEDGTGAVLSTVRPAKAEHHADEAHVGRGARRRARA